MRDENNLSWGTIIIYGLLLAAVLVASFWAFRSVFKSVDDIGAQTDAMADVWKTGNTVMGTAVKTRDVSTILDRIRGKSTYAVELHYTVNDVEYTSPAYQMKGEVFDALDGEGDERLIEIHYDPEKPDTAAASEILVKSLSGSKNLGE